MEASALHPQAVVAGITRRSPLLRLQSDERLIAMVRNGNQAAFEALVQRYQPRLLAFCRHMLSSQEDAEDVLQEVFAASYNALLADERKINARPWLYRIARNRCLNQLRKPRPTGQDSMDIYEHSHGSSTADTVHNREEFRDIIADVSELPETQRTALLLREIDALSYDQIAEAMDSTVPSVKSLLVRARVSLAEAAESRLLTCGEVRLELGQVAEGLARMSPPVRRHLKSCDRCRIFRNEIRRTNKALASIYPIGPMVILKNFALVHLGLGGGAAAGGVAAGGGSTVAGSAGLAGGAAAAASTGATAAGGAISAGLGTIASKAAAGVAAAALVTAGAVEVKHVTRPDRPATQGLAAVAPPAPTVSHAPRSAKKAAAKAPAKAKAAVPAKPEPAAPTSAPAVAPVPDVAEEPVSPVPALEEPQEVVGTVVLPPRAEPEVKPPTAVTPPAPPPSAGTPTSPAPAPPPPAPPADEPAPSPVAPPPAPPAEGQPPVAQSPPSTSVVPPSTTVTPPSTTVTPPAGSTETGAAEDVEAPPQQP